MVTVKKMFCLPDLFFFFLVIQVKHHLTLHHPSILPLRTCGLLIMALGFLGSRCVDSYYDCTAFYSKYVYLVSGHYLFAPNL